MRRFLGRIVGFSIGALAGPGGALFGFLAGWLVDQFRHTQGPWWRLEQFLTHPHRERRRDYVELWGSAAIVTDVLRADGPPRVVQVEHALEHPWPALSRSRRKRRRRRMVSSRRAVIDLCLRTPQRINTTAIIDTLQQWDDSRKADLLELLVSVACADSGGMSEAELAVIRTVAEQFSLPVPAWHGLDRNACTILGVAEDADEATVRRAFRSLAAELHPDTGAHLEPEQRRTMADAFVRIRHAHDRLLSQIRRRG
ncbi:MAG: DnaJ domain-containing protein [Alkalispirochaeta sp.]